MNRNGSDASPRTKPSRASRTTVGVSNTTRRPVLGSVPADCAEVDGDVAHVRAGGADGLGDHALAIDPTSRHGGDRIGGDGHGGLFRRATSARGP